MSVGLIGNQTEEPVDALDKAKSGEGVVFYVFDIYEKVLGLTMNYCLICLILYMRIKQPQVRRSKSPSVMLVLGIKS